MPQFLNYLSNMYVVILTTALPNIQLFLYDTYLLTKMSFMPIAMLLVLQGVHQLCTAKNQQKHKFYLSLAITQFHTL